MPWGANPNCFRPLLARFACRSRERKVCVSPYVYGTHTTEKFSYRIRCTGHLFHRFRRLLCLIFQQCSDASGSHESASSNTFHLPAPEKGHCCGCGHTTPHRSGILIGCSRRLSISPLRLSVSSRTARRSSRSIDSTTSRNHHRGPRTWVPSSTKYSNISMACHTKTARMTR